MGQVAPKRRFQISLRRVMNQKAEDFDSNAAKAKDHAFIFSVILCYLFVYEDSLVYIEIVHLSPESNRRYAFMHAKWQTERENEKTNQV
jgi:hypothetical protein